ncbi:MAG: hypothetical protein ABJB05_12930 [Parafilimonas sp.]
MKKFAFFTLLSICVTAIAITSGNSQAKSISSEFATTNIADTTPMHHKMMKKDTSMHKTRVKKTTKKMKKPVKDSTQTK